MLLPTANKGFLNTKLCLRVPGCSCGCSCGFGEWAFLQITFSLSHSSSVCFCVLTKGPGKCEASTHGVQGFYLLPPGTPAPRKTNHVSYFQKPAPENDVFGPNNSLLVFPFCWFAFGVPSVLARVGAQYTKRYVWPKHAFSQVALFTRGHQNKTASCLSSLSQTIRVDSSICSPSVKLASESGWCGGRSARKNNSTPREQTKCRSELLCNMFRISFMIGVRPSYRMYIVLFASLVVTGKMEKEP